MANLKGGSFERQLKDIHHRLSAFGESRYQKNDHKTHSSALSEKRAEIARSFANYCENKGLGSKLNEHMTNENIKEFLNERTENLALSTTENYARAFGSMLEGLRENNIEIQADKSVFNDFVKEAKADTATQEINTNRAIENVEQVISNIYETRYESGVIADIQHELGLRVAEAHEIATNLHEYYNKENGTIEGLIGKGNHEYNQKEISNELIAKIEQCETIPAIRTYQDDIAKEEISSHDFRYTYAKEHAHEMTKEELSKELNHNREEMTDYYLKRAWKRREIGVSRLFYFSKKVFGVRGLILPFSFSFLFPLLSFCCQSKTECATHK